LAPSFAIFYQGVFSASALMMSDHFRKAKNTTYEIETHLRASDLKSTVLNTVEQVFTKINLKGLVTLIYTVFK
jgi:ribosomal protein S10